MAGAMTATWYNFACSVFIARCVRWNESSRYCHDVRPPVCLSVWAGVHCDHTVHFSTDLSLWLDSPMFWAPCHQSVSTYSQWSFSSSTWKRGGVWMCKLSVIFQQRLKILSYYWVIIGSHICRVDWHNNGWPWVTMNSRFTRRALSLR